jgi:hypothetical protein
MVWESAEIFGTLYTGKQTMGTLNFSGRLAGLAIAAGLMWASATFADWVEVGDAPEGVPAHQDTVGVGPLVLISGSLDSFDFAVDHVDTYAIIITDPDNFWASTTPALGGSASGGSEDTRLWLWTVDGQRLSPFPSRRRWRCWAWARWRCSDGRLRRANDDAA